MTMCNYCDNARKPGSDDLIKDGWIGCCMLKKTDSKTGASLRYGFLDIKQASEIAKGSVALNTRPNEEGFANIDDNQLLVKGVHCCLRFASMVIGERHDA